jgi:hypothetical protein
MPPLLVWLVVSIGACTDDAPTPIPDVIAEVAVEDVPLVDVGPDVAAPIDVAPDIEPPDLSPPDVGPPPVPPWPARAFIATHPAHLVGGPKAEGIVGDIVMETDAARFVIEHIRPVGGYRMYGGNVVDMGLRGERGDDHFGELWFGWNLMLFSPETAEIVSEGEDGVAHVRLEGHTAPYPWADSFIRPLLTPPVAPLKLTYDYRLRANEPFIELTITALNDGPSLVDVQYPMMLVNQGDGVKVWSSNGSGFAGLMAQTQVRRFAAVGYERSYGVFSDWPMTGLFAYANMELAQFPVYKLAPGEARILVMRFAPTDGGSGGADGVHADFLGGDATGFMQGEVRGFDATTFVVVSDDEGLVGVAPVDARGRFRLRAAPGIYNAVAYNETLRVSPPVSIRSRTMDPPLAVLDLPETATLSLHITDQDGNWIPAQVAVTPLTPGIGPPRAEAQLVRTGRLGDNSLVYVTTPGQALQLQPGEYNLTFTRGYTHDLQSLRLNITTTEARRIDVVLERMVDATGWEAGDFHLHGWWSSDADVPYPVRVRQAAANDISLPVLTEHAYIGDLEGAAIDEGLADWVSAIPAQEVTTFEYGHFNAFPLVYDPLAPSGGAVFEHGREGSSLFDAMRAQHPGEVLIQVNHPRSPAIGFGYFFITGLDSETRIARNRTRWTENWDLIEVFNGQCGDSTANDNARQDWINLTNAGLKPVLSSGSDSHTEAGGVGHPRSWVEVELGAVALDPQAIVAPLKGRKSFVSCGPFVRFRTSEGVGIGGRAMTDAQGEVAFAVTVEAPPWMGLSEARLLENGRTIRTVAIGAAGSVDPNRRGLRLDTVMRATPTKDAWYALEVKGSGTLPFPFQTDVPYALTNGIEIDANRDGTWNAPGN